MTVSENRTGPPDQKYYKRHWPTDQKLKNPTIRPKTDSNMNQPSMHHEKARVETTSRNKPKQTL